jgi:UDP-3-O-[3-hydroxymyristoyl] glucosamine N-acyltransferase
MLSHHKDFSLTVKELARLLDCPYEGDGEIKIRGASSLEKAREGDLVFLSQNKYRKQLEETAASAAIIPLEEDFRRIPVLKSSNPHLAFIKAIEIFYKPFRIPAGIHPTADVSPSAKIGLGVAIGAMSYIGEDTEIGSGTVIFPLAAVFPRVRIGENCVVYSHVSIREDTQIGDRVIIHNGAVIGSDGFGYIKTGDGAYKKIPQIGRVVIEDDVEIGANTAIDREIGRASGRERV